MLKSTVWTSEIKDVDVAVQEDCIPSSITAVPETMKLHQVKLTSSCVFNIKYHSDALYYVVKLLKDR